MNLDEQPLMGFVSSERGHRTKLMYPKLAKRLTAAKQRCTNPKDKGYKNYGARGIEFRFPTLAEAYVWVMENLGPPQGKQEIDRVDNDGHYEPGNLK